MKRGRGLPVWVFGANLFVERRSAFVFFVISEDLAFACGGSGGAFSGAFISGQSCIHVVQVLQSIAGERDPLSGRRDLGADVIVLAAQ